ncbi:MAG: LysR family transcriptional regulator, partial [Aquincola sp.]|nr:LysR family transcriptional regulator [Aquincola sp.]
MDLRQLKYFVRIVELGGLSAAAQSLHVAQPSLSQHVANLEAELGLPLLERGARGARPTPAGRRLYEQAKALLRQAGDIPALVRQEGGEVAGHVRL